MLRAHRCCGHRHPSAPSPPRRQPELRSPRVARNSRPVLGLVCLVLAIRGKGSRRPCRFARHAAFSTCGPDQPPFHVAHHHQARHHWPPLRPHLRRPLRHRPTMSPDPFGALTVERLDTSNYLIWAPRMEYFLTTKGLWEAVTTDDAPVADCRKARAIIGLCVTSQHLATIQRSKTAKEAWDSLAAIFKTKGTASTAPATPTRSATWATAPASTATSQATGPASAARRRQTWRRRQRGAGLAAHLQPRGTSSTAPSPSPPWRNPPPSRSCPLTPTAAPSTSPPSRHHQSSSPPSPPPSPFLARHHPSLLPSPPKRRQPLATPAALCSTPARPGT